MKQRRGRPAREHFQIEQPPLQDGKPFRRTLGQWCAAVGVLLISGVSPGLAMAAPAPAGSEGPPQPQRSVMAQLATRMERQLPPLNLPRAERPPAPAPPAVAFAQPLRPHEIFGFAPYWTLASSNGFDVRALTTLGYFGVDVKGDGSLQTSGSGWDGFQSQALADLVTRVHAGGGKVVLTVKSFDDATLRSLTSDARPAQRLSDALVGALGDKNMDGANLDFEGLDSGLRAGFTSFATTVAGRLHSANPHWQVTLDTYGSSASGGGFFDVASLAPYFDAFFVMCYDMYSDGVASPNAALSGAGWNDTLAVSQYAAVVAREKVLLGVPFYGYEWTTADGAAGSRALSGPNPLSYAQIAAAKHDVYWDWGSQVPWTSYKDDSGGWHEIYYDDPASLSLKAQLVSHESLRGLGIWALGMDGNDPEMMAALLGRAAPLKLTGSPPFAGPTIGLGMPSASPLPAPSPKASPTGAPSASPSSSPSASPTGSPSASPAASPSPSESPAPTPAELPTPAGSPTPAESPAPAPSTPPPPPTPQLAQFEAESLLPPSAGSAPAISQAGAYSNGAQLLLEATGSGDYVTVTFTVSATGTYRLSAAPTEGPARGIYTLRMDGAPVGGSQDTYSAAAASPGAVDYGSVQLSGGTHTLTLAVAGKNAQSTGYAIGLDYFVLTPA